MTGSFSESAEPNTSITLDFYANTVPDPSGYGEGQTYLGSATVNTDANGFASFTATGLAPISAQSYVTATATDSTGNTSEFSHEFHYNFSGFLAPLSNNLAFGLNRAIAVKFQLTDLSGHYITTLDAINSLQASGPSGTISLTGSLTYDPAANQFVANWHTKGLTAGTYTIRLALADGTVKTVTLQLTTSKGSSGLTTDAAGGTSSTTAGALLAGDVQLFVNDPNGLFTAAELARIQVAIASVDAVVSPYGVTITEVTDSSLANVTLDTGSTSAVGSYATGVLGCTTDAGEITIIQGWNWYAGGEATAIGAGQYDFQTVVTHELGHALGLGHSANAASVMYATLTTGTTSRALAAADLNVPDNDTGGACGLRAASASQLRPIVKPLTTDSTDHTDFESLSFLSVFCVSSVVKYGGDVGQYSNADGSTASQDWHPDPQAALNAVLADWNSTTDFAGQLAHILDDGQNRGLLRAAGLPGIDERDGFWSSIGGTTAWDKIITLSGDLARP
jgi:hypothetical protein